MNRRKYLNDLKKIQKSLIFISDWLKQPEYTQKNFYDDLMGYFKELQYNHRIPQEINLKDALIIEEEEGDLHIYFSKDLEDFLTDKGKYIIPEMLSN